MTGEGQDVVQDLGWGDKGYMVSGCGAAGKEVGWGGDPIARGCGVLGWDRGEREGDAIGTRQESYLHVKDLHAVRGGGIFLPLRKRR